MEVTAPAASLVSSTITIVETIKKICDAAKDASGLPTKVRRTARALDFIQDALGEVEKQITENPHSKDEMKIAEPVLLTCKEKLEAIKDIFEECIPKEDAGRMRRLRRAAWAELRNKGDQVDENMKVVAEQFQLLAGSQVFKDAKVLQEVQNAIEDLQIASDDEPGNRFHNHGTGSLNPVLGRDNIQYNSYGGTMNFGPVTYQQQSKDIDVYRKPFIGSWLDSDSDTVNTLDDALERRLDGTCKWVLDRYELKDWLSSESQDPQVLWINGNAGFGKTILCAHIVEYLRQTQGTHIATFFFSGYIDGEDTYRVLRSWIFQLIQDDDEAFLLAIKERRRSPQSPASRSAVRRLLGELLRLKRGCILVVDGLDESAGANKKTDGSINTMLLDIMRVMDESTRLLISSRRDSQISKALTSGDSRRLAQITLDPSDARADLSRVSRNIVRRELGSKPDALQSTIADRMTTKCNGQFLWLTLQSPLLKKWKNQAQLLKTIEETPQDLHQTYMRHWDRLLSSREKDWACILLRWAACSIRPLTAREITYAASTNISTQDVIKDKLPDEITEEYIEMEIEDLCSPLLQISRLPLGTPVEWTIYVPHFTVKEFLMLHLPFQGLICNGELQRSNEQKHNIFLGQICLYWISPTRLRQHLLDTNISLRDYATPGWFTHLRNGMLDESDEIVMNLAINFMTESNPYWTTWRKSFDASLEQGETRLQLRHEPKDIVPSPLYYALRIRLKPVIRVLAQRMKESRMPQRDTSGRSALHIACDYGDVETVQALLDGGANPNLRGWRGRTPLYDAALFGHADVVSLLLSRKADVNLQRPDTSVPLHVSTAHNRLEATRLLLDAGAKVDLGYRCPPIHEAIKPGDYVQMVKLLLDQGNMDRHVDLVDCNGITPVHLCAIHGRISVARLLLEEGADFTIRDRVGWAPIHAAAGRGRVEILKALLDQGAEITTPVARTEIDEGYGGWTGVHIASYFRQHGVMSLLSTSGLLDDEGIFKARTCSRGQTPLSLAATSGNVYVIKLLLSYPEVEIDARDTAGHTPLFLAVQQGHDEVVDMFLKDGRADINAADYYGNTPFDVAVRNSLKSLVKLLLTHMESKQQAPIKLRGASIADWARRLETADIFELMQQHADAIDSRAIATTPSVSQLKDSSLEQRLL